jgi:hypothetical protein
VGDIKVVLVDAIIIKSIKIAMLVSMEVMIHILLYIEHLNSFSIYFLVI